MDEKKIPYIPQKIANYEIKKFINEKTCETTYVLKNITYDVYIVIGDYDYFIWNIMDGKHSLEDINLEFYKKFNKIGIEYIENLIKSLGNKGLIENYEYDPLNLRYKQKLTEIRFPIKNVDYLFEWIYKLFGHFLLNKWAVFIYISVCLIGFPFYFLSTPKPIYIEKNLQNILLLYILVFASIFFHECSHALVCIKYGRKVKDAGFMLYMFMPVFYVNTSDIWMENKKARIVVSLAGPFCDAFIGSLCYILYLIFIEYPVNTILYQIALLAYVRVALNLNPLFKWDGYYCLMDIMGVYNLREKSIKFVKDINHRFKKKQRFNYTEMCLLMYGILSTIYVIYFMVKMLYNNFNFWITFNGSGLNIQVLTNIIIIVPFIVFFIKLLVNIVTNFLTKIKKEIRKNI